MTLEEYAAAKQAIVATAISYILNILFPWRLLPFSNEVWQFLLRSMFPIVENARRELSELSRDFYDAQRRLHFGDDDYPIDLAPYEFQWFEEAMRPSRDVMRRPETTEGQLAQAVLRVAKEVENGARRTTLYALQDDPRRVGWARVATGRETCAFCLMLVSRGPVYQNSSSGFKGTKEEAMELLEEEGEAALKDLMTRWHPGCDCIAVPVFDRNNWPGREDYLRAEQVWRDVTGNFTGVDKLNAFRRAVYAGELNPADFAAAA
jgi:hypothetical protein